MNSKLKQAFSKKLLRHLTYQFQPIINLHTGSIFGYEALLCGYEQAGFATVSALFAHAQRYNALLDLEKRLRVKIVTQFRDFVTTDEPYLLLNVDPRILALEEQLSHHTATLFKKHQINSYRVCFELTEIEDFTVYPQAYQVIGQLRQRGALFAIDHFGSGYSGLKSLYNVTPDILKIDRFFIANSKQDNKKRLFVNHTVQLAHTLGIQVIADGIETEEELHLCRDSGCDFAQGTILAKPAATSAELDIHYEIVQAIPAPRRHQEIDINLIRDQIEAIPTLYEDDPLTTVFDFFKRYHKRRFFPVINRARKPVGLICEESLKKYIYASYGRDLLANPAYRKSLRDFILPCPMVDIHSRIERLLEAYVTANRPPGIIMTETFMYCGFISQDALLQIVEHKNLAAARDQNPLTSLPGNHLILEYVAEVLEDVGSAYSLAYFDFDYFKPFNDLYGFRTGDRAINLFADLLRKHFVGEAYFIGHVGGDDFFAGFQDFNAAHVITMIRQLLAQFAHDVQSFYDPADRERGFIEAPDRSGVVIQMPLLKCSAAVLHLPCGIIRPDPDSLSRSIAGLKKRAKQASDGLATQTMT
jgi:diguanylate cyclase (GGDEF)-like protein